MVEIILIFCHPVGRVKVVHYIEVYMLTFSGFVAYPTVGSYGNVYWYYMYEHREWKE